MGGLGFLSKATLYAYYGLQICFPKGRRRKEYIDEISDHRGIRFLALTNFLKESPRLKCE